MIEFFIIFGIIMLLTVVWVCWMSYAPSSLTVEESDMLDLRSLANLLDPSQEAYLRVRLKWRQFLTFRLLHFLAAHIYLKRASRNAAVLIAVGRNAARADDPEIALAGRNLEKAALRVRIYAPLVLFTLAALVVFPGSYALPAKFFAKRCEGLKDCLDRLGGLRQPSYPPVRLQFQ